MIPNLIHPVPISIQQLDLTNSIQDEDMREPVQQNERSTTKIVNGQVKWTDLKKLSSSREGVIENSTGYVLFRYVDLESESITLKREDRIIKIGTLDVDVYIVSLVPLGHYSTQGGPTMVKAMFDDRQPSRQE
jgi:hypothetical protein